MKTPILDSLMVKPQPVELGELTVWIKPLDQINRDMCQAYARRASRDFRKKLIDPDSDEHQLLVVEELQEYNRTQLELLWINNRIITKATAINRQSLEDRDLTFIPEPEGPDVTNSDIEQHELAVEEIEEQRETGVRSAVVSAQTELREEVKEIPLEQLQQEAEPALIENILTGVWLKEFNAQICSRETFSDEECQKPAFKATSEVKTLRADYLDTLVNAHYALMVEPEALKN